MNRTLYEKMTALKNVCIFCKTAALALRRRFILVDEMSVLSQLRQ